MEDYELLKGIKNKNVKCYEALIDKYIRYVTVVVSSVGKDTLTAEDIEEISSDVFIKIWTDGHKIDLKSDTFKPYLAKVARNMTINKLRKLNKGKVLPIDEDIILIDHGTPADNIITLENAEIISTSIKEMEEPDREIFIRRYFFLEKVIDIAGKLGINENTVATKLSRCRKALKKSLIERGVLCE
jgi:RNA polymerase sigma-70 factor (ECF subfamily)